MKKTIELLLHEKIQASIPISQIANDVTDKILGEVRKKIPKSIYVNGLRKFNKSIPMINAYNSYRKEVLKILNELSKGEHYKDGRTKEGREFISFMKTNI